MSGKEGSWKMQVMPKEQVDRLTKRHILIALAITNSREAAAERLGLSLSTLNMLLHKYGLVRR